MNIWPAYWPSVRNDKPKALEHERRHERAAAGIEQHVAGAEEHDVGEEERDLRERGGCERQEQDAHHDAEVLLIPGRLVEDQAADGGQRAARADQAAGRRIPAQAAQQLGGLHPGLQVLAEAVVDVVVDGEHEDQAPQLAALEERKDLFEGLALGRHLRPLVLARLAEHDGEDHGEHVQGAERVG